jgi:hypothetical protein
MTLTVSDPKRSIDLKQLVDHLQLRGIGLPILIRFSDKPTVETDFTSDAGEIIERLSFIHPEGWTALHDAIYLGVHRMKSAKNARRVLFILSDGADNNSRYTEAEVKNLVMESDVRIYAIGLFERPKFLEKLAARKLLASTRIDGHTLEELLLRGAQQCAAVVGIEIRRLSPWARPGKGRGARH